MQASECNFISRYPCIYTEDLTTYINTIFTQMYMQYRNIYLHSCIVFHLLPITPWINMCSIDKHITMKLRLAHSII